MNLLLKLAGFLSFLVAISAFCSVRSDNIAVGIFCLGWSVICFYVANKND